MCFRTVFFADGSGLAVSALALPVSAFALVDACAFDTGAFDTGAFDTCVFDTGVVVAGALAAGAGAGADCAGAGDVTANCNSRTARAARADRRTGGVTRDGESKQGIVPLYAELDASERRGESLA